MVQDEHAALVARLEVDEDGFSTPESGYVCRPAFTLFEMASSFGGRCFSWPRSDASYF